METKFTKSTDKEHEIVLESSILHAVWSANTAYAGGEVGVEVKTMFVGEGGKISISGKSDNGENLGKIKDKIYGNSFSGKLKIPDRIEPGDMAYFTVKLSQLGLKAESNRIPIVPRIEISDMKWDKNEARRGDTLKLSADVEGVRDESEVKVLIYQHSPEGNHDKIAEIPTKVKNNKVEVSWDSEYHDDTTEIPSQEEAREYGKNYNPPEYFFVIDINGQKYGQEKKPDTLKIWDYFEISLVDEKGDPVPNEKYVLHLADGDKRKGTLDNRGKALVERIPPGMVTVEFPDSEYISAKDEKND